MKEIKYPVAECGTQAQNAQFQISVHESLSVSEVKMASSVDQLALKANC